MISQEYYDDIEKKLLDILSILSESIDKDDITQSTEYIDVGEYGLSLDGIVHSIVIDGVNISLEQFSLIKNTAEKMKMEELLNIINTKLINNIK